VRLQFNIDDVLLRVPSTAEKEMCCKDCVSGAGINSPVSVLPWPASLNTANTSKMMSPALLSIVARFCEIRSPVSGTPPATGVIAPVSDTVTSQSDADFGGGIEVIPKR
jgi:hypothetical protein